MTTTTKQTSTGRTGAQPSRGAQDQRRRGPAVLRAVASLVALLALVVGVPVLLLALGDGLPIPTSWPDRETLTSQIGTDDLVTVLVAITWLAWLQFLVCVAVEVVSELRGVGLPARVPFAGPSQRLARTLVAGVLMLTTLVGAGGAATASTIDRATNVASIGAMPLAVVATATNDQPAPAPVEQVAPPVAAASTQKLYTVVPRDSLWDIAERCLGDGRRYKEIYVLNEGRPQPHFGSLTDANLIYPGWVLVMPDDAVGVELATAPAVPAAPAPPSPALPPVAPGPAVPGEVSAGDLAADPAAPQEQQDRGALPRDLVAAGLLAAGLSAALVAARRRYGASGPPEDDALDAEVAIRLGAEPELAGFLDDVLRTLSATCRHQGRSLPSVYAARVLEDRVDLHLAPADLDPPLPWTADADGRTWSCSTDLGEVPELANEDVLAPYPGLVGVGRDADGAHVLIDLEAADGPVSIYGDEQVSREVVVAAAAELATNSWSDHLRVTLVDVPAELAAIAPERVRVATIADVLPELRHRAEALRGRGDGVLTGRLLEVGGEAWMPEYLVLGSAPADEEMAELEQLMSGPGRAPFGVLVAADVTSARWRLYAATDGRLTSEVLGIDVEAQRLSDDSAAAVRDLFEGIRDSEPEPVRLRSVDEASLPEDRAQVPAEFVPSAGPATRTTATSSAAAVQVLGPIEVRATGSIEPNRRAQVDELAVYLALHPGGVHANVLSADVWPRGVTVAVREAALARFRDWVGVDAQGHSLIAMDHRGRLSLRPSVGVDLVDFCGHVAAYRRGRHRDREQLRRALDLVRGPVLAGMPTGRYSWVARTRVEYDVPRLVVDTAHVLASIELKDGDPSAAAAAARRGLLCVPTDELLWRDLMRAEHAVTGRAGAQAVLDELLATHAAERDVDELEAETESLVEELLPQRRLRAR